MISTPNVVVYINLTLSPYSFEEQHKQQKLTRGVQRATRICHKGLHIQSHNTDEEG